MYWVHSDALQILDALLASKTDALLVSVPPADSLEDENFHRSRNIHMALHARGRFVPLAEMAATGGFPTNHHHFQCQSTTPVTAQTDGMLILTSDVDDCFDACAP